ncbi:MAG TPA: ethanolamine ammonia-lyase subunit EutC, partial [Rhodospirillales bacterium]|nr:ethanolamine ammonia-lyase subunit EutC [Rhodospirillales bacterium]
AARIALGRSGDALPTERLLEFQRDHARARDAVHLAFDAERVLRDLAPASCVVVRSQAPDRVTYLQRPDLGRRLNPDDRALLPQANADASFVVCDGLSALGVHTSAAALINAMLPRLDGWRLAPVVLARQGRVALGDDVALALGARMVAVLIGERPGLSAADSLGVYLTWAPRADTRDAERNCISNIRPGGLGIDAAAAQLLFLMAEARRLECSGVALKADHPAAALGAAGNGGTSAS